MTRHLRLRRRRAPRTLHNRRRRGEASTFVGDAAAARPADDEREAPCRDADGRLLGVAAAIGRRPVADDPVSADPELLERRYGHNSDPLTVRRRRSGRLRGKDGKDRRSFACATRSLAGAVSRSYAG